MNKAEAIAELKRIQNDPNADIGTMQAAEMAITALRSVVPDEGVPFAVRNDANTTWNGPYMTIGQVLYCWCEGAWLQSGERLSQFMGRSFVICDCEYKLPEEEQ